MAVILGQNQDNSNNNQEQSKILTPQNTFTQEELLNEAISTISQLMKAYESVRKYMYELGEHHNSLVREFRIEIQNLKAEIASINDSKFDERIDELERKLDIVINSLPDMQIFDRTITKNV